MQCTVTFAAGIPNGFQRLSAIKNYNYRKPIDVLFYMRKPITEIRWAVT